MHDHQYAYNVNGSWVNARLTKYLKYSVFFCDCPARHRMKLVKPSGKSGRRGFCDYFAHIVSKSSTKSAPTCISGGESVIHRMAKQRLREAVGLYQFAVFRCALCGDEERIDTKGCKVTIEVRSSDRKWRYDCLLSRENTPIAALEVVHMHRTGDVKAAAVRESGLEIAEFRAEEVMNIRNERNVTLDNLHMRVGKCRICLAKVALKWQHDCFFDELAELIIQDEANWVNYARADVLRRVLATEPLLEKCKRLFQFGLNQRITLRLPKIGEITCSKMESWQHGVLVSGFNRHLPTRQLCVFFFENDSDVFNTRWQFHSIPRDFHVFLHCSTVLSRLGSLAVEQAYFKDCRWPILKELEHHHGLCANCGKTGHTSDICRNKFCVGCGRFGHVQSGCYARTDILGNTM